MSKRESYEIAGEIFSTKLALQEYIKEILYRYQDGQYLSGNDFEFMLQVLKRHPDFEIKNGIGVKAFFCRAKPCLQKYSLFLACAFRW